jgi:two-component system chemotaxis response regulator CheY
MSETSQAILIADPDPHARKLLAAQLQTSNGVILHAADATSALALLAQQPIAVLVTELYLAAGEDDCLVHAVRRNSAFRKTRIVAHTHRSMAADREWAMRAGADAYLIKPTRPQRMRYVVGRLTTARGANASPPPASTGRITRRDSLDLALHEIEAGKLEGVSAIVFGRGWWEEQSPPQRTLYRNRAKKAHVSLRSDSMLGKHFVEVRGPSRDEVGLATERPESPYWR